MLTNVTLKFDFKIRPKDSSVSEKVLIKENYLFLMFVESVGITAKSVVVLATAHTDTLLVTENVVWFIWVDVMACLRINNQLECCVYVRNVKDGAKSTWLLITL